MIKNITITVLIILVSMSLAVGCNTEFEVIIQSNDEDMGTVTEGGTFEEGKTVLLKATPKEGYAFIGWEVEGEKISQDQKYELEVETDKEVTAQFDETIDISDDTLKTAIRDELNKSSGEITLSDMKNLENLEVSQEDISDLTGLEYAVNLTNLRLRYNEIEDLTPLEELKNLEESFLNDNKIEDIAALTELTGLEKLDLSNNEITDIKVLKELTNLKEINLAGNEVDEISFLEELSDLEKLFLIDNDMKLTLVDFDRSPGGDYIAYRVKEELPLTRDVQVVNINENVSTEQVFEKNSVTEQSEFYSFAGLFPLEHPFTQTVDKNASAGDRFIGYNWAEGENALLVSLGDKDVRENKENTGKEEGGVYKLDLIEKKIVKVE